MATGSVTKPTISNLTAAFFYALAVFFDLIKIALFLIDAIPIVGVPIGFIGSWIASALEFICITVGLYIAGAYKGKNSTVNALITMGLAMIDFVPILNDFPSTTLAVVMIIIRSRINDKVDEVEQGKKKVAVAKNQAEQEAKEQKAQEAVVRADEGREEAMAISVAQAQQGSAPVPTTTATAYARRPLPDGRSNPSRTAPQTNRARPSNTRMSNVA